MEELCNSRQILRFVKGYKRERERERERGEERRERENQWREGPRNFDSMVNFTIWESNLVVSTLGGLILLELNREDCISNIVEIWYL